MVVQSTTEGPSGTIARVDGDVTHSRFRESSQMVTHGSGELEAGLSRAQESGQSPTTAPPRAMQTASQEAALIFPKDDDFCMEEESIPHLTSVWPQSLLKNSNMMERATKWFFKTASGTLKSFQRLDTGCLQMTGIFGRMEYASRKHFIK